MLFRRVHQRGRLRLNGGGFKAAVTVTTRGHARSMLSKLETIKGGELVARALAGAWRAEPALEATLTEASLGRVAPLLVGSSTAALAWWKVRRTPLRETEAGRGLLQAYRLQTLKAAVREAEIERLFTLLDGAGVEAVLVKGHAAGLAYAEHGLRPAGDIDLCVRPEHYAAAKEALASPVCARLWVDLHAGFGRLLEAPFGELFERSRVIEVGRARVRVLGEEEHLRLLCLHLLRHGGWRSVWLCDVAASVEARGAGFEWGRVLGSDPLRAHWVACTLGLARDLLGARTEGTPAARRLPRWLMPSVLRLWESPYARTHEAQPLMKSAPRRPAAVLGALRRRWPDPVRASVRLGASFDDTPRLPLQLRAFIGRGAHFLSRLRAEPGAGGA